MKAREFWFVVGSQHLYGPEVLQTVAQRAQEMADTINASEYIPYKFIYKATVKTSVWRRKQTTTTTAAVS